MEMAEVDRKSDGKMAATGKVSSSGATARRRSRGRVLGKRRLQADDDEDEEEEAELEEEEKQEPKPASVQRVWTSADFEKSEGFLRFIGKTAEEYAASKAAFASRPRRIETAEEWEARVRKNIEEQDKAYEEMMRSQDDDESNWDYIAYRNSWNDTWSGSRGSFEEVSEIFSVKVAATSGGLQWPLDVFGIVSIRDSVDRNRNVVFHRTRDNCQTLTEQERNLVLVGPTRAVVLSMPDPLIIDVEMKVKGTTESEDKRLSLLAVPLLCAGKYYSHVLKSGSYTSKLSTLEFRLGYIVSSVEATISVRVIRGSWPDGFHGQFAAYTTGVRFRHLASEDILAGIELEKIVLLDSRGDQNVVTVSGDGTIELSRRVVSVEKVGKLKVLVRAWELVDHNNVVEQVKVFTPLEAGLSNASPSRDGDGHGGGIAYDDEQAPTRRGRRSRPRGGGEARAQAAAGGGEGLDHGRHREERGIPESIGKTAEEYAASKASRPRKRMETAEEWEARVRKSIEEQDKAYLETMRSQDEDESNWEAIQYRKFWNDVHSAHHGSFQDATTSGGLQWPLDVFGIVTMRDSVDRTKFTTSFTRAIVLSMPEPVIIDVELKVKGTTESEDKHLSYLAVPLLCHGKRYSRMLLNSGSYTSKLSTLEFRLGYIVSSVEATIFVRVICGSWPDGFHGQFAAFTTGVRWKDLAREKNIASVDDERILLLDSRGDQKVVVTGDDGKIVLSRCVVSVEDKGELKVHVRAWKVDDSVVEAEMVFTALKAGLSNGELDMGFCKLGVSVAWSLISRKPVYADSVM
uniref:DUF6598 domain-containing protein n=1 Tax=Oryza sativa subsp. japonica TaxID=39947 RepID=Q6YZ17_ORYSJ|nr:hypothetical protein [Oryza sativa Japonica Group]BAD13171.1 hypothetical protein [Oryza sativa Japonica Group]